MAKAARTYPDSCIALASGRALFAGNESETAPSEVEIVLEGSYKTRNFSLDEKAFDQIIANHRASGVDPAIDREHESWLSNDAVPARGWVKNLSKRPSTVDPNRLALVGQVEWNDLGLESIAKKHFRYLSAGLNLKSNDRQTGEPIGAVLDHVALVKNPFIQGMSPLSLSNGEKPMSDLTEYLRSQLGLTADADEGAILQALREKESAPKSLHLSAKAAEALKVTSDAEASEKIVALSQRIEALEGERLSKEVDEAIADFLFDPAERDAQLEFARQDPVQFRKLKALRVARKPGAEALKLLDRPRGENRIQLQTREIEAYMAAHHVSFTEATVALVSDKPELFEGGV